MKLSHRKQKRREELDFQISNLFKESMKLLETEKVRGESFVFEKSENHIVLIFVCSFF